MFNFIINTIKHLCFFSIIKSIVYLPQVNSVNIEDCSIVTNYDFNKKYMFCDYKEQWNSAQQFCNRYGGN